jgi:translocation and assembly module TamA
MNKELYAVAGLLVCMLSFNVFANDNIEVIVSIENVDKKLVQSIQENLFINSLKCDETEWRVRHAAKKIDVELGEALNAYGYYNATFTKKIEKQKDCWQVDLSIDPGPRTKVTSVEVIIDGEAKDDKKFLEALDNLPLMDGDLLRHDKYDAVKEIIEATAQTRGYFDGKYKTHTLRVNKANNIAKVLIHYESGARYRLSEVIYDRTSLKEELFKKYLSVNSGDYYLGSNIIKTYQDLSGSGYYSDVEVKALFDQRQDGAIPVEIKLIKAKRRTFSVGVGASTDTGPRFRFEHKNRKVNDRGHYYDAKLLLSPVISNLSFNYKIPISQPQTDFISLQAGAAHEDTDTSESDSIVANFGRTKLRENGWLENIFLEFLLEDFEVGEDNESSSLLMPGVSWNKTRSNNPIYPTLGYHLSFEVRGASQSLLSDVDLLQLKLNSKGILPLGKKARILSRLQAGYNFVDDFTQLPSTLRFFSGGDNSIRGYEFESLGPEGSDGDVIGGEGVVVGSLEADYLFKPKWALAAFVDAGNAFEADDIQIKQSAGVGIRWRSPIGPVKVDVAFPVDEDDSDEDDFRIHFSLGPEL